MTSSATRAKRRPRARIAAKEKAAARASSSRPRIVGIALAFAIAATAVGVAVWQPTRLLDMFAPVWTSAGPALILLPLIALAMYTSLRLFGFLHLRTWRFSFAAVLAIGVMVVALNLLGITDVRGVPVETGLADNVLALSTWARVGILLGLGVGIFALASPYGALLTARASGRASRAASVAGARAAVVGGSVAGRGSARAVSLGAERASGWLQNSRVGGRPPATDDVLVAQTRIPRSRIVVSEPSTGPALTDQNRYPPPMGAIRDESKARHEAHMAAKETASGQAGDATGQESGLVSGGISPRPRIVMAGSDSGTDSTGEADDSALENVVPNPYLPRMIGRNPAGLAPRDLTGAAKTAGETEEEPGVADGLRNAESGDKYSKFSGNGAAHAEQEVIFSELNSESDGIYAHADDNQLAVESDEDVDAVALDSPTSAETGAAEELTSQSIGGEVSDLEDDYATSVIDDELDDDEDEWESDALDDEDDEDSAPNYERSGEEILASQDPFAGLPKVAWKFPPLEVFQDEPPHELDTESHMETAEAIQETLQEYGIEVDVSEVRPGPTVTLYGLRPGWDRRYRTVRERNEEGAIVSRREEVGRTRIKVDAIAKLDDDLALQLKAASVRIEPIAGTNLVGVEVPNVEAETVYMRPQLESDAYKKGLSKSKLAFPLGKGSGGEHIIADLARMPHLLVAGSTGSGKSVFVNSLVTSIITRATPEEVRFIMVDPKRVELTIYNGIPHLITPVIVDTQKVVNALQWMVTQMEQRLEQLAEEGARDIGSYNEKMVGPNRMPYLVLIVDELADLMMTAGKAVEHGLVRLAQMGRATGIHLVVATQRPSVNVITGLIKANFPTRISFMVTSLVDSRTILDGAGAEKLLGRGDMLYLPQDASRPIRIQSAFLSLPESDAVVEAWKEQSLGYIPPELPDLVTPEDIGLQSRGRSGLDDAGYTQGAKRGSGNEDIMEQAKALAELYNGKISTSLLQRRLGIGYPRAARLRDQLVEEGVANAEIPNAPAETGGRGLRKARMDDE